MTNVLNLRKLLQNAEMEGAVQQAKEAIADSDTVEGVERNARNYSRSSLLK